ncbi:SDR family oxidoreductase [Actinacidiphila glaucinigra]|uniref:SDR family oxidoreductase n=1 Tax=Actinacidiphila glaucinigra TaxID=235986 RepID=UPI0033BEEA37
MTWQDHLDQLTFFVKSPTPLMQAVQPCMRERGGGRIIRIGSDVLECAAPEMSAYAAAKGRPAQPDPVWARALGPFGITVNTVAPGWIPVERHAGWMPVRRPRTRPSCRCGVWADRKTSPPSPSSRRRTRVS